MFEHQQKIPNPFGITVFGSALKRVAPDVASIRASVSIIEKEAAAAFSKAKRGAQSVQEYLRKANITDFGTSRVALTRQLRFVNGVQQFIGYQAKISLRLMLDDLDHVDEMAERLVLAGANEIERIAFETTKLREVRAEARRKAMAAAFEKARNYCAAGGVELGRILHIEDVNPLTVQAQEGHLARGSMPHIEEDDETRAIDPSLIEVGAAVLVAYAITSVA